MTISRRFFSPVKFLKTLTTFALLAVLSACGDSGLEIMTEFRDVQGLREGTKVYFEERNVGEVIDIDPRDSGSLITMIIDPQAAAMIDSQAAIVVNRIKPGAPLEIYSSAAAETFGLKQGQHLKGLNSMIELVAWSVGDAIQFGSGELSGYVDSFQEYLQGEKFQQDRARVEAGVKEMAAVASETIKSVEQDLATALSEVSVSEEELAKAIQELGDELSPIAEEMAKDGTDLMAELEKFSQGVESLTAQEQESGRKLIESIIATIEKLNNAAEQGAQRSVDEAAQ